MEWSSLFHDGNLKVESSSQRWKIGAISHPLSDFEKADAILVQLAHALAYIHSRGMVHRDVTPGNIMIAQDGTAKLMDFGVVKEPGAT